MNLIFCRLWNCFSCHIRSPLLPLFFSQQDKESINQFTLSSVNECLLAIGNDYKVVNILWWPGLHFKQMLLIIWIWKGWKSDLNSGAGGLWPQIYSKILHITTPSWSCACSPFALFTHIICYNFSSQKTARFTDLQLLLCSLE